MQRTQSRTDVQAVARLLGDPVLVKRDELLNELEDGVTAEGLLVIM